MSISSTVIVPASVTDEARSFQTLASGGRVKLDRKVVQMSAARGTTGRGVKFVIENVGTGYLRFGTDAFSFSGTDASQFAIVGGSLPRNVAPGKKAAFYVALKPSSDASVSRVLSAKLNIKQRGASSAMAALTVRGLATTGEGGDKEPSLARLLELFQYGINVGDTSPETTFLDLNGEPTEQATAGRFFKAGGGPVTIDTIAQFVPKTTTAAGRIGTYEPGTPQSRRTLFSLNGIDGQSVNPLENGPTSFDPGTRQFSLFAEAPKFTDDGRPRIIYGEDQLNTWEPNGAKRNKVKAYPLKENGAVVPNAYLVAFEEFTAENDQNDYVLVVRNVVPAKSQPELGLVALNGQIDAERLAFNRIQNLDADLPNQVADEGTVRIVNTGNRELVLSSITLNASSNTFQLLNKPTTPFTIRRGTSFDLRVKFVAEGGRIHSGSIVLNSNDRDEPSKTISLSGFWQSDSEQNSAGISQEPSLAELFQVLGFRTRAVTGTENIDGNGETKAVGDEVLADSWSAADSEKPVFIQEIAGFHSQGNVDQIAWYPTGQPYYGVNDPRNPGPATNGPRNLIFENEPANGQTFFPRRNGEPTLPAQGSFRPGTQTFGLRVSGEFSDDELNNQAPGDLGGHHFRFYPARDARNNYIADTYLVVMDFSSINFDYNDHLFLVSNLRPSDRTPAVNELVGSSNDAGVFLDWSDVRGASGYAVLSSATSSGPFERITTDVLTTSEFVDRSVGRGKTRYYRIVALNDDGEFSMPANVSVRRPRSA